MDLGDVWGKVLDLAQRDEIVADDPDVRPFHGQHFLRRFAHCLSEGVILVEQIDLANRRLPGHIVGHYADLRVGMHFETKVPEIAFRLGQCGVERVEVEEQDLLIRIAGVMLYQRVADCVRDVRCGRSDETDVLIDGLSEDDQRFLRVRLVVEGDDLDFPPAEHAAAGIDDVGAGLEYLEPLLALQGERPAHRPQNGEFYRVRCRRATQVKGQNCARRHAPEPARRHSLPRALSASTALSTQSFILDASRPRYSIWQRASSGA